MKIAYCKIELGDFKQKIVIKNGFFSLPQVEQIPTAFLSDFFAKDESLQRVYLSGAPISFLQKIEEKTKEKKQTVYNNNQDITFIYSQI